MPTTFDKKEKKENEFLIFLLFEVLNRIHETSNFTKIRSKQAQFEFA